MNGLLPWIERFAGLPIWVVGDLMLDDYLEGVVDRVSPEAPVQVVRVGDSFVRLGGAGNVAAACTALGARPRLAGVLGRDPQGDQVLAECERQGIETSAVLRLDDRPTTRKLRVMARHQQILRLDWEERRPVEPAVAEALVERLGTGPAPAALLLSDYEKGLLTPEVLATLLARARRLGVPVVVDPKSAELERYRGATVLTPNQNELEKATGRRLAGAPLSELVDAAREGLRRSGAEALCLTLGPRGLVTVERDGRVDEVPATAHEVFDVTGAGDTVAAVLALSLGAGASLAEAVRLANAAAGVVVGKAGTAVVSPRELRLALEPRGASKVVARAEIAEHCEGWRHLGRRVVFTNGCFDLLHVGHLKLLREAASHGDILVVGLNSDASVRRLKGEERPLVGESERAALIAALEVVDGVVIFEEDTPLRLIEDIRPDVLVKGADYAPEDVVGREQVEATGGRLVLVDLLPDRSTSALVDRMNAEDKADQTARGQSPAPSESEKDGMESR